MLRSQFLSSWLSSKNLTAVGFGMVVESLFEMWLSDQLETCAFNALELSTVADESAAQLQLDAEQVTRLLIRLTRRSASFKSDGEIITFR